MNPSPIFVALLREGTLASRLLGTGVTTLRKGDADNRVSFWESLFNLAVGIERVAKLAVIVDYRLENGKFPTDAVVRKYSHDIQSLFDAVVEISNRRGADKSRVVPQDPIHIAILRVLSDFARVTRYQNLDFIVGGKGGTMLNPEHAWSETVGKLIIQRHYSDRRRTKESKLANGLGSALDKLSATLTLNDDGAWIRSAGEAIQRGQRTEFVQRHAQFYTLQLIRFFVLAIFDVECAAHKQGVEDVPFFGELFSFFFNDDKYFKRRKTWVLR